MKLSTIDKTLFLFATTLAVLSIVNIYLYGYYHYGDIFTPYFAPDHRIWDETFFYFTKVERLLDYGVIGFKEIKEIDSFSFDMSFPPLFINASIACLFGLEYFPIAIDVITASVLFTLFYLIGTNVLRFDRVFACFFAIMLAATIGYGPSSYYRFVEIFINFKLTETPLLGRQESASTILIFLSLYILSLSRFFRDDSTKNRVLLFLSIALVVFGYAYYGAAITVFSGLLCIAAFFWRKEYFKQTLFLCLATTGLFLFWQLTSGQFSPDWYNIAGTEYNREFRPKVMFVSVAMVAINYYIFTKRSDAESKNIFIIFIFLICAGTISYYNHIVTGKNVINFHWETYFLRPIEMANILYWVFLSKFPKKYLSLVAVAFTAIICFASWNFTASMFKNENKVMVSQFENLRSYKNIDSLVRGKTVLTIDPLYIFAGQITNGSFNFIPYILRAGNSCDGEFGFYRYLQVCAMHGLSDKEAHALLFKKDFPYLQKFDLSLPDTFPMYNQIVFGEDGSDNKLQSLDKISKDVTFDNLPQVVTKEYAGTKAKPFSYSGLVLINKNIGLNPEAAEKSLSSAKLLYEDKNIKLFDATYKIGE